MTDSSAPRPGGTLTPAEIDGLVQALTSWTEGGLPDSEPVTIGFGLLRRLLAALSPPREAREPGAIGPKERCATCQHTRDQHRRPPFCWFCECHEFIGSTPAAEAPASEMQVLLDDIEGGLRYAYPILCRRCVGTKRGEQGWPPCNAQPACLDREQSHAKALAATRALRGLLSSPGGASGEARP